MASLSFRDRFYSPSVARALTSPSGILALGAGAAAGIVLTALAAAAAPVTIIAAVVGGAIGYGGRVAMAIPKKEKPERIDPFGVKEPWRHAVKDAVQARNRFAEAVKTFQAGPLRDSMTAMAAQLDEAVSECWRVAKQGQIVADARQRINDREANWELQQAQYAVGEGGQPNQTQARTIAALESQLATAARMDAIVASTRDQLALLNARLDESVTRAIELSVSNRLSDAATLGDDVGDIVTDLESLRMAIEDVDDADASAADRPGSGFAFGEDGADLGPASVDTRPPPPRPAPPPPTSEPGGQSQASPGS